MVAQCLVTSFWSTCSVSLPLVQNLCDTYAEKRKLYVDDVGATKVNPLHILSRSNTIVTVVDP